MADLADFNAVFGMNARIDMAVDMLNEKRYAEAEAATRAVLEHRLSRWQQIYATILLADCMNDWYEAEVSETCRSLPYIIFNQAFQMLI